jgi:REP element-mobilizing transposase RayT
MIGAFKSITTDEYIRGVREEGWPRFSETFWQRNFYEHIVRNEEELEKIRDYIRRNPLMWAIDRYNPDRAVPVVDQEGRVVPWEES